MIWQKTEPPSDPVSGPQFAEIIAEVFEADALRCIHLLCAPLLLALFPPAAPHITAAWFTAPSLPHSLHLWKHINHCRLPHVFTSTNSPPIFSYSSGSLPLVLEASGSPATGRTVFTPVEREEEKKRKRESWRLQERNDMQVSRQRRLLLLEPSLERFPSSNHEIQNRVDFMSVRSVEMCSSGI